MKKTLFQLINRNQGYYELTVKETEKSIIVVERTNHSGHYDKEIRYRKSEQIMKDVQYLIKTGDACWFAYHYAEPYENGSYWQRWEEIF